MPVRSLSSSVFKWPDARTVDHAVRAWAKAQAERRSDILRIGYLGSYARGDWGVGSDVDILIVVQDSDRPFAQRPLAFDATCLPVPADVLVYTHAELRALSTGQMRFARVLSSESVWVYDRSREGAD
ncbi:MAG: nucleotidyltransferase domain-containing protein [Planctomycetes bacterium]|nr:nucleotidyltransferase domain-containing protein [Planctomycetota bacterium]MBM4081050.1 nucleotidyltransferase domain-containing protein [Planctomycetota bacterium]MBM4084617.1 nucleotidyltransferase domain-containing protein [Planctomycetota bacterium]